MVAPTHPEYHVPAWCFGGGVQAVRNLDDLETMACPPKYRSMQSFYKYYSGEKVAPYPTIFSKPPAYY